MESEFKVEFKQGIRDGLPIFLGYQPAGIAYGLLAKQAGLNLFNTLFMSAIVYAGTAQFIAVALIQAGQDLAAIVLSTFIVNLRYFLMNGSIVQSLSGWPKLSKFLLCYYVSDETFVVLSNKLENQGRLKQGYGFGVNTTALTGWILSSTLGFVVGQYIPDLKKFGFDFALTAVLIALSTLLTRNKRSFLVGLIGAAASLVFLKFGYRNLNVFLAALTAALLGLALPRVKNERR